MGFALAGTNASSNFAGGSVNFLNVAIICPDAFFVRSSEALGLTHRRGLVTLTCPGDTVCSPVVVVHTAVRSATCGRASAWRQATVSCAGFRNRSNPFSGDACTHLCQRRRSAGD